MQCQVADTTLYMYGWHEPERENDVSVGIMQGLKPITYKECNGRVRGVGGEHDQKHVQLKDWLLLRKNDLLSMPVVIRQKIVAFNQRISKLDIKVHSLAAHLRRW